jgi:pimeloyl-ACP methyl ester carboxylesterase
MTPTRGQVIVNNRIVSYLRWGSGTRHAVLLHGVTSSARSWWRVAPGIASLGYCVTAFDMPGHGESNLIGTFSWACLARAYPRICS